MILDKYDNRRVGRALKSVRREAKVTQQSISIALDVVESTVSHMETGRRKVTDIEFAKFCLNCGVKQKVVIERIEADGNDK